MKKLALVTATALFSIAGIGVAAADGPYPVRNQGEAIDIERQRAAEFNSIQPDPFYYGNNPGTHATGAQAYDPRNDAAQTVIYQQLPSDQDRANAQPQSEDAATEAPDNKQTDQTLRNQFPD